MKFEKIKLIDIEPADYNPRYITTEELEKLSNSIHSFGFVDPIIINLQNNRIVGGHQRYKVLMEDYNNNKTLNLVRLGDIGWAFPNDELKIEDDNQEKALNIALNKIQGEWDDTKLAELFKDIDADEGFDVTLTGFSEFEVEEMLFEEDGELLEDYFDASPANPTHHASVMTEEELKDFEEKQRDEEIKKELKEMMDNVEQEENEQEETEESDQEAPSEDNPEGATALDDEKLKELLAEIQTTKNYFIQLAHLKIQTTKEEFEQLKDIYEKYTNQYKVNHGFIKHLLSNEL